MKHKSIFQQFDHGDDSRAMRTFKHLRSAERPSEHNGKGMVIGVTDLTVRFGPTQALRGVNFEALPGEVHALAGENGSGKSTLLNVLSGTLRPTTGSVRVDGTEYSSLDRDTAQTLGIGIVYQELSLFPHLTGTANITIGHESTRFGLLSPSNNIRTSKRLAEDYQFPNIQLDKAVNALSVRDQQIIEVLKCLYASPKVVLFDEPTASLNRDLARQVLHTIRQLRDSGLTVVFVSHYLDEIYEIADRVTVLRDGRAVRTASVAEVSKREIIKLMIGHELANNKITSDNSQTISGNQNTSNKPRSRPAAIARDILLNLKSKPINFIAFRGEITGLAGDIESGAPELAEVLAGLRKPARGVIEIGNSDKQNPRLTRWLARKQSSFQQVGYVGPDRRTDGLLRGMSVSSNLSLSLLVSKAQHNQMRNLATLGFISRKREKELIRDAITNFDIHTQSQDAAIESLSGGNQQKVIVARWILAQPDLLILNNPTVGVDVGAREGIYEILKNHAAGSGTVIILSNDPQELKIVCDRVVAFYDFRIVGEWANSELTDEKLLQAVQLGEYVA